MVEQIEVDLTGIKDLVTFMTGLYIPENTVWIPITPITTAKRLVIEFFRGDINSQVHCGIVWSGMTLDLGPYLKTDVISSYIDHSIVTETIVGATHVVKKGSSKTKTGTLLLQDAGIESILRRIEKSFPRPWLVHCGPGEWALYARFSSPWSITPEGTKGLNAMSFDLVEVL
jgi:hypothetical protein